ncbi:MAG TPA: adenosine deaminase [Ktedonosporobacter sp.]|nr:adenosine deaminase [Ktedonosporobacter sp.]
MSIEEYLNAAPKAELHLHLEGAVRPATLLTLARRNGVELPVQTVEEAQQWFKYRDFSHFVDIFVDIARCIQTVEDYELVVYELAETLAQQNARYAEVTFSPSTHEFLKGVPHEIYFTGLTQGRQRALRELNVEINWIFDIVRTATQLPAIPVRADYTLKVALEGMSDGVIGLGLGGNEAKGPPEPFAQWFEQAKAAGLHSVPHAGEHAGPASIWGALHVLGAERIGHGVRAIEDPELVAWLAEKQILLEVSPTSNICLDVYPDYEHHPFPKLLAAGVPLTVNTDDPPLFNTTLNHEVNLLHSAFHLDLDTIDQVLLNGICYSFLPPARKQALEAEFQTRLTELRQQYVDEATA